MNFKAEMNERVEQIEQILDQYLPPKEGLQKTVLTAMNTTVKAGGKRLRPMLINETYKMFGGEGDIVGRPGGDEFIVYLTHVEDTEMLEKRCEQLCEGLRSLLVAGKIKLTASVGAVFCTGSLEYSALYELADQALYQTKRAGRDGYRISRASSSAGDLDGG